MLTVILTGALTTALASGSQTELVGSFQQCFWWATGFTALGVALSFLLPSTLPTPAGGPGGPGRGGAAPAPADTEPKGVPSMTTTPHYPIAIIGGALAA